MYVEGLELIRIWRAWPRSDSERPVWFGALAGSPGLSCFLVFSWALLGSLRLLWLCPAWDFLCLPVLSWCVHDDVVRSHRCIRRFTRAFLWFSGQTHVFKMYGIVRGREGRSCRNFVLDLPIWLGTPMGR